MLSIPVAKFIYEILAVFYSVPMYVTVTVCPSPDPFLYSPSLASASILLSFSFVLGGNISVSYLSLGLVRWLEVVYMLFLMRKGDVWGQRTRLRRLFTQAMTGVAVAHLFLPV